MVTFANRKAAWTAMLIIEHLNVTLGNIRIEAIDPNRGDIQFRKLGASFLAHATGKGLDVNMLPVQSQSRSRDEFPIATCTLMADALSRHNPQFDAYRPLPTTPRRNAFGDLCHKPDVEGYDEPYVQTHDRARYEKLAQAQKPGVLLDGPRSLVQARLAFRQGR